MLASSLLCLLVWTVTCAAFAQLVNLAMPAGIPRWIRRLLLLLYLIGIAAQITPQPASLPGSIVPVSLLYQTR